MRIVLLTAKNSVDESRAMPLALNDRLLCTALSQAGAQVQVVPWEEWTTERIHPERGDLALIGSTWNSHLVPEHFVACLEQIASRMPLRNALPVVLWNMNKYVYARDLAQAGFPIIPTIWLHPGERRPLSHVLASTGWRRAVLKPTISANSFGTCQFSCEEEPIQVAQRHLNLFLHVGRTMMLQPYLPAVQDLGEHRYVFIGGSLSHAFSKTPFGTYSPGSALDELRLLSPPEDEIRLAQSLMRWVASRFGQEALLCGRVDLVRDEQGEIRIMELELIEPLLHLEYGEALPRLVDLILTRGFEHASCGGQEHCEPPLTAQEACR